MKLDFSKCKTKEDVEDVWKKAGFIPSVDYVKSKLRGKVNE